MYVLDVLVLPKVTTKMPDSPVDSISEWKHLTGLDLADPEFGTPGREDVLLRADYYGEILLHGRRLGPRGTPFAQKTCMLWVSPGRPAPIKLSPTSRVHLLLACRERLLKELLRD